LWIEMPEKPKVLPPTAADSPVEPCTVDMRCTRSAIEVTPEARMASAVTIVTGSEPFGRDPLDRRTGDLHALHGLRRLRLFGLHLALQALLLLCQHRQGGGDQAERKAAGKHQAQGLRQSFFFKHWCSYRPKMGFRR
jgi:hypothetical protein